MTLGTTSGTTATSKGGTGITAGKETPRQYQMELFQRALEGNIIAVLDTGTGKTLIALLLLKQLSLNSKKISIFLVPTIPLVSQQAAYLTANSTLRIGILFGQMRSSELDKDIWKRMLVEFDVIVLTPNILLNALDRAYCSMSLFHLIIFNEAHHTKASHPYNTIMKLHYGPCPADQRPKIFGMVRDQVL